MAPLLLSWSCWTKQWQQCHHVPKLGRPSPFPQRSTLQQQWPHIHAPRVGHNPPPTIAHDNGTLRWHATNNGTTSTPPNWVVTLPRNQSTLQWRPAMPPWPLHRTWSSPSAPPPLEVRTNLAIAIWGTKSLLLCTSLFANKFSSMEKLRLWTWCGGWHRIAAKMHNKSAASRKTAGWIPGKVGRTKAWPTALQYGHRNTGFFCKNSSTSWTTVSARSAPMGGLATIKVLAAMLRTRSAAATTSVRGRAKLDLEGQPMPQSRDGLTWRRTLSVTCNDALSRKGVHAHRRCRMKRCPCQICNVPCRMLCCCFLRDGAILVKMLLGLEINAGGKNWSSDEGKILVSHSIGRRRFFTRLAWMRASAVLNCNLSGPVWTTF